MFQGKAWLQLAGLVLGLLAGSLPAFGGAIFKTTATGTPKVQSIEVIAFGPNGTLLIGDGRGAQLVAIDTGDITPMPWTAGAIERIDEKLAGRIGTTPKGIEILHLAVNPASGTAYIALRKQDDKKYLILTVDGSGKIAEYSLENVKYAAVRLPKGEKSAVQRLTDLTWAGDRVLVGGLANEEFACKVYTIPVPLDPAALASSFSTETYHVSHRRWETKAPMTSLMPLEEGGKKYVVGAFACTPLVKYPVEDVAPDAHVKGQSVVELGSGNQPLHMFSYEKDGKTYVLMNTYRFHHKQKPYGPSPYWTVRLELGVLKENEKINQKALLRLDGKGLPATDRVKMIDEYNGVVHLDKLDKERALVVKQDGKSGMTLTALALP